MSFGLCPDCAKPLSVGDWPMGCRGTRNHIPRGGNLITAYHHSEKSVVYINPRTGERRIPARADQAMTEIYSRQGYERVELDSPQRRREFEKKTGLVQEVGSFDINTGSAERSLTVGVSDAPMPKGLDAGVSE